MQVLHEQQVVKSLPLKGMVGHVLSFEQFLTQMLHQARAQARLRSFQERKYRTAAFTVTIQKGYAVAESRSIC
jgi:hypothetical protein